MTKKGHHHHHHHRWNENKNSKWNIKRKYWRKKRMRIRIVQGNDAWMNIYDICVCVCVQKMKKNVKWTKKNGRPESLCVFVQIEHCFFSFDHFLFSKAYCIEKNQIIKKSSKSKIIVYGQCVIIIIILPKSRCCCCFVVVVYHQSAWLEFCSLKWIHCWCLCWIFIFIL